MGVDDMPAMPLAQLAEGYIGALRARARPRTVKESQRMLERVIEGLGVKTVAEITRAGVKAWRERLLASGSSNKTANNLLAVLLAALADAVENEILPRHPLAGFRSLPVGPRHQRRRPRALADWEITKLLAALAEMDANPPPEQRPRIPQELLVRILLETGARWGELTLATWADVDTASALLRLRGENTKTDTERSLPLRRDTCERLVAYRLECASLTGSMPGAAAPIFLSPHGRRWSSASNFRKLLGSAYELAGLLERNERGKLRTRDGSALNIHTLRHTACTRLLLAGVPVPAVQALLGHASPQMTLKVYSHIRAESCRSWVEEAWAPRARSDGEDSTRQEPARIRKL